MIGKLICYFKGHKRGREVGRHVIGLGAGGIGSRWTITYQCPRCKAQWTRKKRVKA